MSSRPQDKPVVRMRFESQIQIDFVAYDLFHRFGIIVVKVAIVK